ncbi:MAG: hypothetical protein AAFR84_22285 [Pseudomonadota bacterium]
MGRDRKTVRRYLERGLEPPAYKEREPVERKIAPFEAYLRQRVIDYPDLSVKRLLREIRDLGYKGGYPAVTAFLRDVRPARPQGFERRFEAPPRRQAQVDFAEFKVEFTDEPGTVRKVWLFLIVLGHSRWLWVRFGASQDLQTVLRCHIAGFEAIGGVTGEILYDRMKTAVIGEDADGGSPTTPRSSRCSATTAAVRWRARPTGPKPRMRLNIPFLLERAIFFGAGGHVAKCGA